MLDAWSKDSDGRHYNRVRHKAVEFIWQTTVRLLIIGERVTRSAVSIGRTDASVTDRQAIALKQHTSDNDFSTSLILGALALAPAVSAQSVDTSDWVCEYCPFEDGHRGDYAVGASQVSDDSAYFGNATGYDEEGTVANLDGDGSYGGDTYRMRWLAEDLALDSRALELEGSHPGVFDYYLDYSELPYRRFITTQTVFSGSSAGLTLPSDWVTAGTPFPSRTWQTSSM